MGSGRFPSLWSDRPSSMGASRSLILEAAVDSVLISFDHEGRKVAASSPDKRLTPSTIGTVLTARPLRPRSLPPDQRPARFAMDDRTSTTSREGWATPRPPDLRVRGSYRRGWTNRGRCAVGAYPRPKGRPCPGGLLVKERALRGGSGRTLRTASRGSSSCQPGTRPRYLRRWG